MIDLSKLSPAPWTANIGASQCPDEDFDLWYARGPMRKLPYARREEMQTDAAFIALARNAFDVMLRRGWHAQRFSCGGGMYWFAVNGAGAKIALGPNWYDAKPYTDPFTALVEADTWYKANVEAAK